ncbi:hypothetical protein AGRO_4316 [Agrobacterium sp. ATCC 31749]|nr:hypothetical protein AGRO_4316 [Agrobacterium sp. ATCC 31749]
MTCTVRVPTGRRAENTDLDVGDDHNSSLMQMSRRFDCRYVIHVCVICQHV